MDRAGLAVNEAIGSPHLCMFEKCLFLCCAYAHKVRFLRCTLAFTQSIQHIEQMPTRKRLSVKLAG